MHNRDKLKEQVEKINKLISEGKAVDLTLRTNTGSARLLVRRKEASPVTGSVLATEEAFGTEAEVASLDLTEDITDAEISEKIKKAAKSALMAESDGNELPVVILTHDDIRNLWILAADCSYTTEEHNVTALHGFETDLSSIPRIFWSIIDPPELSLAAPLFHDLIYRCAGELPSKFGKIDPENGFVFTREEVDDLFLELMTKAGIPSWKRNAAYWAVRGFAGFAWRKQD
jgi:uncharacterized protein DUF1353